MTRFSCLSVCKAWLPMGLTLLYTDVLVLLIVRENVRLRS